VFDVHLRLGTVHKREVHMEDRWLSVEEIAEYLGINRDTVYKWLDRKRMPAHKVGRLWKFKKIQIDRWVEAGKAGPDPKLKGIQK